MSKTLSLFDENTTFETAIYCMITENGYGEALAVDDMTADQKARFKQIKDIYIEEKLKDCKF